MTVKSEIDYFLQQHCPCMTAHELYSPMQLDYASRKGAHVLTGATSIQHLKNLQKLRVTVGVPLLINHGRFKLRGFRHFLEQLQLLQQDITHSEMSTHVLMMGTDCTFDGLSTTVFWERYKDKECLNAFNGRGLYNTFMHLDSRNLINGRKRFWDFRSK
jgi:hypothetical protein